MPKVSRQVLIYAVAVSVSAFALTALAPGGAPTVAARALVIEPRVMPLGLPDAKAAKAVLSASLAHHHPQWIDVPIGASVIRTFVIYPDLSGRLPVAVVTDQNQAMSDWARAVGTQVVNEGFITVVPDLLSGMGPNGGGTDSFRSGEAVAEALSTLGTNEIERRTKAVRDYFASQPGSNGDSVTISFNWPQGRIDTAVSTPTQRRVVRFDATEHAWHNTLALLTNMARPAAELQSGTAGMPRPKDDATLTASAARQRAAQQEIARRDDIPPGSLNGPGKIADQSPRRGRWIDIPATLSTGAVMMRTWVVEPLGNDRAGVVVVIHPGPGMDIGGTPKKGGGADWMRALADKVAFQGFIVVMPDLASGMGPDGGNFDSFQYSDDLAKALGTRSAADKCSWSERLVTTRSNCHGPTAGAASPASATVEAWRGRARPRLPASMPLSASMVRLPTPPLWARSRRRSWPSPATTIRDSRRECLAPRRTCSDWARPSNSRSIRT